MNPNAVGVDDEAGDAASAGTEPQENDAMQPAPQLPIPPQDNIPGIDEEAGVANVQQEQNVEGERAPQVHESGIQAPHVNAPLLMMDLDTDEDEMLPPISPIIVRREQIDREFRNASDMVELEPAPVPAPDEPVIEVAQAEVPLERPEVAAPVERPRVAGPVRQLEAVEDMFNNSIDEELTSISSFSSTSSTGTSNTETSDENHRPANLPFYRPGLGNGPSVPMIYVPGRYPPGVNPPGANPAEPAARREGPPQPSRPIMIPAAARPLPSDDDDDSSSPEMGPRPKRRRSDRSH